MLLSVSRLDDSTDDFYVTAFAVRASISSTYDDITTLHDPVATQYCNTSSANVTTSVVACRNGNVPSYEKPKHRENIFCARGFRQLCERRDQSTTLSCPNL